MNITYFQLSLEKQLKGGPFFPITHNLTFENSYFSHFLISLSISPKYLTIKKSIFSKFLDQVIKQSKINNERSIYLCSSFKDIQTPEKGSVFNIKNSTLTVERCSFSNIETTDSGACFYAEFSNCSITKCTFYSCHAFGGNAKYGNAYLLNECNLYLSYSYTLLCAPSIEESGDSTIAALYSTSINVSYLNSSKSHGEYGSASITYRQSTCENSYLSFLTITDAIEHNTLEFSLTHNSFISYGNFINTTQCFGVINNNDINYSLFEKCAFINSAQNISTLTNSSTLNFKDCFSNDFKDINGIEYSKNTIIEIPNLFYSVPLCSQQVDRLMLIFDFNFFKAFSIFLTYHSL